MSVSAVKPKLGITNWPLNWAICKSPRTTASKRPNSAWFQLKYSIFGQLLQIAETGGGGAVGTHPEAVCTYSADRLTSMPNDRNEPAAEPPRDALLPRRLSLRERHPNRSA